MVHQWRPRRPRSSRRTAARPRRGYGGQPAARASSPVSEGGLTLGRIALGAGPQWPPTATTQVAHRHQPEVPQWTPRGLACCCSSGCEAGGRWRGAGEGRRRPKRARSPGRWMRQGQSTLPQTCSRTCAGLVLHKPSLGPECGAARLRRAGTSGRAVNYRPAAHGSSFPVPTSVPGCWGWEDPTGVEEPWQCVRSRPPPARMVRHVVGID